MNLRTITNALFEFDAHYPRTIIATIILINVLFGWKVPGLEMDLGLRSGMEREHKIVKLMEIVEELFSGSEILIVGFDLDRLFFKKN
jgi:hypothetical protein